MQGYVAYVDLALYIWFSMLFLKFPRIILSQTKTLPVAIKLSYNYALFTPGIVFVNGDFLLLIPNSHEFVKQPRWVVGICKNRIRLI